MAADNFRHTDLQDESYEFDRVNLPIFFQEETRFKDTYGGEQGNVFFDAHLLKPRIRDSKTVIVFSHPIGGGAWLPMVIALAAAGHHVMYSNGRYQGNDTALIMEKCVVDLGKCIEHAKNKLGYERIVLGGWSGGGSLSLYYQEQAERPSVTCTPAGDLPDLTRAGLTPAHGIMLIAAHVSRAHTLTEWMDAAITDESDPSSKDPELDLYNADNPNQPPYTDEFLTQYREAQIARNRRITSWVRDKLERLKADERPDDEFAFVVHGTMADPRWLDPAVDPSERTPGRCYLGDPRVANNGPVGLARFCTLRSWLSQWSYDESRADGVRCAAAISIPALSIGNLADEACTPSHTHRLYNAVAHDDKEIYEISGATHYYMNQPRELAESVAHCTDWLKRHDFWD